MCILCFQKSEKIRALILYERLRRARARQGRAPDSISRGRFLFSFTDNNLPDESSALGITSVQYLALSCARLYFSDYAACVTIIKPPGFRDAAPGNLNASVAASDAAGFFFRVQVWRCKGPIRRNVLFNCRPGERL